MHDHMPKGNCVDLKDEKAFILPTVFGYPDGLDFSMFGYSSEFSCDIFKKCTGDDESYDLTYQTSTNCKDMPDPAAVDSVLEKFMLETLLFGNLL